MKGDHSADCLRILEENDGTPAPVQDLWKAYILQPLSSLSSSDLLQHSHCDYEVKTFTSVLIIISGDPTHLASVPTPKD